MCQVSLLSSLDIKNIYPCNQVVFVFFIVAGQVTKPPTGLGIPPQGWTILLKGVAGAPGDLFSLWASPNTQNEHVPAAQLMTSQFPQHYKPDLSNHWSECHFDKVHPQIGGWVIQIGGWVSHRLEAGSATDWRLGQPQIGGWVSHRLEAGSATDWRLAQPQIGGWVSHRLEAGSARLEAGSTTD